MTKQTTEQFPSLEVETRTAVNTEVAAFHLNRRPQTLRSWACFENGPIRPMRINGRLAWPVRELRRMLGCAPFHHSERSKEDSVAPAFAVRQGEEA